MLTIEYTKTGVIVSDFDLERYVDKAIEDSEECEDAIWRTASEILILAIRAAISEGKIDHKKIKFLYKGSILEVNEHGNVYPWPMGFCECNERLLERLLGWG